MFLVAGAAHTTCESKGSAKIAAVEPRPCRMMNVDLCVLDVGGTMRGGGQEQAIFGDGYLSSRGTARNDVISIFFFGIVSMEADKDCRY